MRTRAALAAVLVCCALSLPAEATPRPPATVVTGTAGSMADVTFPTSVSFLDDGGASTPATASKGDWAGFVLVAAAGDPITRKHLISVTMPERFRCPGSTCAYSAGGPPPFGSFDRGRLTLPAGRYRVILAGERGATVSVTLRPQGATGRTVSVRSKARPATFHAAVSIGQGTPGHETQLHAYDQIPDAGRWSATAMYVAHAAAPVGAFVSMACLTTGSTTAATQQVGGVAPCADREGTDLLSGPNAGPVAERTGGAYAPVSVSGAAVTGPSGDAFGVGFDVSLAAPESHLRSVFIGVSVD